MLSTEYFLNLGVYDIVAQIIGFLAAALGILCFQAKKGNQIIFFQAVACVLWVIHMVMLGAYTGAFLNGIFAIRGFLCSLRNKVKFLGSPLVPIISLTVIFLSEIFIYSSPYDILPLLGAVASTLALLQKEEKKIRIFSFFSSPCWLIYDGLNNSLAGVITEIFVMCSIIIALIRFRKMKCKIEDT